VHMTRESTASVPLSQVGALALDTGSKAACEGN
jgi:hypothetical protein